MGIRKSKKLRTIFIEYIISIGFLVILLIVANYILFTSTALMYPANYTEKAIQRNYDELKEAPHVTMDLLTPMSSFGVFSPDGQYLYGNFSARDIKLNWDYYRNGDLSSGLSTFIVCIDRDSEVLIISYPLSMQFKNDALRNLLPHAEMTAVILFLLQLLFVIVLWSNRFAKRINRELTFLLATTKQIQEQNLDFKVGNSRIEEIDGVLKGIDTMRVALKISLEEQWSLEKQKREQVSALTHDLKTPLTIVKGNAELLMETTLTEEQRNYCKDIEKSSLQMDHYIHKLLTISKNELDHQAARTTIEVTKFLHSIKRQTEAISKIRGIGVVWQMNVKENLRLTADQHDLERAIMNIITNAFDFSPGGSTITINSMANDSELTIQVIDQGKGFTKRALKHGKEQLFMENESRTKNGHHGLGLYIANTIITNDNGELILSNDEHGGGSVTAKIPLLAENMKYLTR